MKKISFFLIFLIVIISGCSLKNNSINVENQQNNSLKYQSYQHQGGGAMRSMLTM